MKVQKIIILISVLLLTIGCMPDSWDKWDAPAPSKPSSGGSGGSGTDTGLTAPTEFKYPSELYELVANVEIDKISPTVTGKVTSYSISPALPAGLTFSTTTGAITGTPTEYSEEKPYMVTANNSDGENTLSTSTELKLAVYIVPAGLSYTQSSRLVLELASITGFTLGASITTSSATGTITAVDTTSKTVDVSVLSGQFTLGDTTISPVAQEITGVTNVYYQGDSVELTPSLESPTTLNGLEDVTYSISPDLPEGFDAWDEKTGVIKGTVSSSKTYSYVVTAKNDQGQTSTSFKIGPYVEAPADLSYSQMLLVSLQDVTPFVDGHIISSTSGGYGEIMYYDEDLSFVVVKLIKGDFLYGDGVDRIYPFQTARTEIDNFYKIKVGNVTDFAVLDKFSTQSNSFGEVRYIDTTNKILYVKLTEGTLNVGDSLDDVYPYVAQSTTITTVENDQAVKPINAFMTLAPLGGRKLNLGSYVSTADGYGLVQFSDKTNNKYYFTIANGSFSEAAAVDDTKSFAASIGTVSDLLTKNYVVELSSGDGNGEFYNTSTKKLKSFDFTTPAGAALVRGTLGDNLYITKHGGTFNIGDSYDPANPFVGIVANPIENLSTNNIFYIIRKDETKIKSYLPKGNDVVFTINPALPAGLTIDSLSGDITGTPENASSLKYYTITATNTLGSASNVIGIKIDDVFRITNQTENATSYIMHQTGQNKNITPCEITRDMISSSDIDAKDILCRLEGGELDLYDAGVNFKVEATPGVCEYIELEPYYFYSWQPRTTSGRVIRHYTNSCEGIPANYTEWPDSYGDPAEMPSTVACEGDYSRGLGLWEDGPNCDAGSYVIKNYTYEMSGDPAVCVLSEGETVTVSCGGHYSACIDGAIKDQHDGTELEAGVRSNIYSSSAGFTQDWKFESPISKGHNTNLRLANFTINNSCGDSNQYIYYSNNWDSYGSTIEINSINDPFKRAAPFYTVNCLDAAFDVKARIRIQVRDWDRTFSYQYVDKNYGYSTSSGVQQVTLDTALSNTAEPVPAGGFGANFSEFSTDYEGKRFRANSGHIYKLVDFNNSSDVVIFPFVRSSNGPAAYTTQESGPEAYLMDSSAILDDFGLGYNERRDWDDFAYRRVRILEGTFNIAGIGTIAGAGSYLRSSMTDTNANSYNILIGNKAYRLSSVTGFTSGAATVPAGTEPIAADNGKSIRFINAFVDEDTGDIAAGENCSVARPSMLRPYIFPEDGL